MLLHKANLDRLEERAIFSNVQFSIKNYKVYKNTVKYGPFKGRKLSGRTSCNNHRHQINFLKYAQLVKGKHGQKAKNQENLKKVSQGVFKNGLAII